jgi:hypothetical protein
MFPSAKFLGTGEGAYQQLLKRTNENIFLTHCRWIARILIFAYQAWKMDTEDPRY